MAQTIGSIIKLKPEFEERYIILHQYTFPQVLERIRSSNIRNYSIFLKDGLLFSYYEYNGNDYKADLAKLAEDPHTQNWWKLTDPMQEPVEFRSPDEWWAVLENIYHFESEERGDGNTRILLRAEGVGKIKIGDFENIAKEINGLQVLSLFTIKNLAFLYAEMDTLMQKDELIEKLKTLGQTWTTSEEVFHTN